MRPFTIIDCDQRTPEWFAARCGRATGTTANKFLAKGKGSAESVQRTKLKYRLALERLTGRVLEKGDYQSDAMKDGVEREPLALSFYEASKGVLLERAGFCSHNELMIGCSVDAYFGDFEGLVSIKCPEWHTHAETLRGKTIELEYMRQIIHEQYVTGALWTDFVSFHPDFPERLQLAVIRVPRKEEAMAQHDVAVRAFMAEVQAEYDALRLMSEGITAVAGAVA